MQNEYFEKINSFRRRTKRMPSYSEMMQLFGLRSKNAVYKIVHKLIDAGLVKKDHLGRLMAGTEFEGIHILGSVTAGLPAYAEEDLGQKVNLNDMLIGQKKFTYMLEVDGDSMIDAHIEKGDMVLVEKTESAKDMDIVIAEIDGEFTMKFLRQKGTKSWLEPANKKYSPIYPEHSLKIIGRIKAVIRQY